jgi:hypothetical protein
LQGEILAELERFVAWDETKPICTFGEIEEQALAIGRAMSRAMMKWAVVEEEAKAQREPATPEPACQVCKERMRDGGRKKREIKSKVGRLEIERGYYHCRTCGAGFFPLDGRLGIEGEKWSMGLRRVGAWLAVQTDSYERAMEGLEETLGVRVSVTSLWRVTQGVGKAVRKRQQAEAQRAWSMPERGSVVKGETRLKKKMGVALDGVYIHLLKEGWKEVKIGAFFEIKPLSESEKMRRLKHAGRPSQAGDEIRDMVRAEAISYCAVLGSVEEFEPMQWNEAQKRQLPQCWDSVVVGDGADWIDRIHATCYHGSERVVDWYHACEHLGGLARQAFGEGTQVGHRWFGMRKDDLWRGQVHAVVDAIRGLDITSDERGREANYFTKHQRGMNYLLARQSDGMRP